MGQRFQSVIHNSFVLLCILHCVPVGPQLLWQGCGGRSNDFMWLDGFKNGVVICTIYFQMKQFTFVGTESNYLHSLAALKTCFTSVVIIYSHFSLGSGDADLPC